MPLSYLPEAVPTSLGWAHPLTGEQLTAGAISEAELDEATPVAYYKPNAGKKSFIDPEDEEASSLIFYQATGKKVRFSIHPVGTVGSVVWDFGDRKVSSVLVTNGGEGYAEATVAFAAAPTGGVTATGEAVIEDGVITEIVITNPGAGYTSAPAVTITGDGEGATATAVITGTVAGGLDEVHNYAQTGLATVKATITYLDEAGEPGDSETLTILDIEIK